MLIHEQKNPPIKISLQELVDSYKESLGEEGAKELIKDAIRKAGMIQQKEYVKEDIMRILNVLQEEEGFIGILAGILLPRFIIRRF